MRPSGNSCGCIVMKRLTIAISLLQATLFLCLYSGALYLFKGTSGFATTFNDYRNAEFQKEKDYGPIPEGMYRINLEPDPERVARSKSSELVKSPQGGIEQVPAFLNSNGMRVRIDDIWGTWRALLEPLPGTKTYGRTNFYFHNSEKGHTGGCIEVSGELHNVLVEIRNSGQKYIDVKVDYPTNKSSTYGHTDKK